MRKQDIPNLLTLGRVAVIPVFVLAFWLPSPVNHWLTALLFAAAGITDFFDGYLARKWSVTTRLGQMLDPIADKLLVATALVMLVSVNSGLLVPAVLILCRELFISGLREFMAKQEVIVQVTQLAKWKTAVQMISIFLLLLGEQATGWGWIDIVGQLSLWIAAVLTVITGWHYLKACLPKLK